MAGFVMEEQKLKVFIDTVSHYMSQTGNKDVEVDTPYIVSNSEPVAYDFTGLITISGPHVGSVYFSAPSNLIRNMLHVLGEPDDSIENMTDMVGEVANTISGNARKEFGSDFIISVPTLLQGVPSHQFLPKELRSYAIPIHWRSFTAVVVICLQKNVEMR